MINLKALGLALVAVFALSAMAAASASAQNGVLTETNNDYPVHIHGQDTTVGEGEVEPALTASGGEVQCDEATYTGTLAAASSTLDITATYGKCFTDVATKLKPVTVTMGNCFYRFHTGSAISGHHNWNVTSDLLCSSGIVEIHHYANATDHAAKKSSCTLTVAQQTGLAGVSATNESGPDAVKLRGTVKPKAQTHGACSFGFTLTIETELHVNATVEGTEGKEIHVGT